MVIFYFLFCISKNRQCVCRFRGRIVSVSKSWEMTVFEVRSSLHKPSVKNSAPVPSERKARMRWVLSRLPSTRKKAHVEIAEACYAGKRNHRKSCCCSEKMPHSERIRGARRDRPRQQRKGIMPLRNFAEIRYLFCTGMFLSSHPKLIIHIFISITFLNQDNTLTFTRMPSCIS